jgi:hypothetical protein
MNRRIWIFTALLILSPATALAQGSGLDVNVGSHVVRVAYDTELTLSGLDLSFEGLHNTNHGDFAGAGLGLRANANPGGSPVYATIGVKALWINPSYPGTSQGTALALGGGVELPLPQYNRIMFGGYVYWAPSVTSFGRAKRFLEEEVRAGYRVLPNGTVYLGYRHVTARFENMSDLVIDSGINLGFSLRF